MWRYFILPTYANLLDRYKDWLEDDKIRGTIVFFSAPLTLLVVNSIPVLIFQAYTVAIFAVMFAITFNALVLLFAPFVYATWKSSIRSIMDR